MAALGPFEPQPVVAVAVSGGPDSTALALLADGWARAQGGRAVALTVDHRLRPDSAAEAAAVHALLAARGIDHRVLVWDGPKPAADVQAAARAARYRLLGDWCREAQVLHLLLAHHQDDQAETLLLRLGRGSGVDGLAAMAPVQETRWGRLLRPLLGVPRARLAATVADLPTVDDPSNRSDAFSRARLRQLMPALAAEGLSPRRLAATAGRMGRARAALEHACATVAARTVELHPAGFALVAPAAFDQPAEVALRLLGRVLGVVGGGEHPLRLERVERLLAELRTGLPAARTLGGCRVAPWRGRVLVSREAARLQGPVALVPGAEVEWDGRFRAVVAPDAASGLKLGALGDGRRLAARSGLPSAVWGTLPAILDQDGISAVPHLGYNLDIVRVTLRSMVAAPPRSLTVAGHCLV
ncbi:MAG: tRNA lysidine(34) synthetase TilS [Actinomycetota bacterium]